MGHSTEAQLVTAGACLSEGHERHEMLKKKDAEIKQRRAANEG
jgi:hypothetical protein